MKIAIAADHAGFRLKAVLGDHLRRLGHDVHDFGTHSDVPVDYPDLIRPAAQSVAAGQNQAGIVIGGSGNGEAMAANKVSGVRCALCWNGESARLAKAHNDANMIAIGARMVDEPSAIAMVDIWLEAVFEEGRHRRRIDKLERVRQPTNRARQHL